MKNEIILAIIQAATEFLPVSSSGHLAIVSNLISEPNLFFIVTMHLASLLAVLIFTRKELIKLAKFDRESIKYIKFLIIATIPAIIFGLFLKEIIESAFSSFLFIGIAYFFTGTVLAMTKIKTRKSSLNYKNSLFIGLFQALALFPGVSRSGMTISSSLFAGIEKEKAVKFSFILFIPLAIGSALLEVIKINNPIDISTIIIPFFICFVLSLVFLNVLNYIIKKEIFWIFSIYCYILGIICFVLYALS
jgi:undecaprenyl-diphosphatase